MAKGSDATQVEIAGRAVRLTSPDKIYFADRGFTKRDVFDYYRAVGDGIMRALGNRPTTLQRFPEGLDVVRRGPSGTGSTGLGLSIVAAIVEAHGKVPR